MGSLVRDLGQRLELQSTDFVYDDLEYNAFNFHQNKRKLVYSKWKECTHTFDIFPSTYNWLVLYAMLYFGASEKTPPPRRLALGWRNSH